MHEEHHEENEPIDGHGEQRFERAFDDAVSALFDDPDTDPAGDAAAPRTSIDPELADHVRTIAAALRAVDATPSDLVDAQVGAALDTWDALTREPMAVAEASTPVPIRIHSQHRSARRSPRPRSFSPASAWFGAAAALVLVVAGAAVVIDRSGRGGSDDVEAGAVAVEHSLEAESEMYAFDAGEGLADADMVFDATDEDTSWQTDDRSRADDDVRVGDRVTELPGSTAAGRIIPPWVGAIESDQLDVLVVDLLPGVPLADDVACVGALDHLVAEGMLDDRPVLIGAVGSDAVALDMRTCEVLASAPVPEARGR